MAITEQPMIEKDPEQEDDQDGLAAGFARGDQAHQYVDEQDDGNQDDEDSEDRHPEQKSASLLR